MSTTTAPRVRPAGYSVVRAGRAAFLLHRRAAVVAVSLVVLLAAACLAYLCVGESFIAPAEVLKVITGKPSPDELVVGTLRAPAWSSGFSSAPRSASRARSSRPSPATRWRPPTSSASARARAL